MISEVSENGMLTFE